MYIWSVNDVFKMEVHSLYSNVSREYYINKKWVIRRKKNRSSRNKVNRNIRRSSLSWLRKLEPLGSTRSHSLLHYASLDSTPALLFKWLLFSSMKMTTSVTLNLANENALTMFAVYQQTNADNIYLSNHTSNHLQISMETLDVLKSNHN